MTFCHASHSQSIVCKFLSNFLYIILAGRSQVCLLDRGWLQPNSGECDTRLGETSGYLKFPFVHTNLLREDLHRSLAWGLLVWWPHLKDAVALTVRIHLIDLYFDLQIFFLLDGRETKRLTHRPQVHHHFLSCCHLFDDWLWGIVVYRDVKLWFLERLVVRCRDWSDKWRWRSDLLPVKLWCPSTHLWRHDHAASIAYLWLDCWCNLNRSLAWLDPGCRTLVWL